MSRTACSLPPCQKKTESALLDWSGSGSSSRELFNDIHFLPNGRVPKYIPLGPDSEDFNVITEDDFSSNSNKKGNVFVDDFYYDYNFINFHEDLSYDAVDEKDGRREDSKPDAGTETIDPEKDSEGSQPRFLPPLKTVSGSPTLPTIGQNTEDELDDVRDRNTVVDLHNISVASSTTTSFPLKSQGIQTTLWEDGLSPSATGRHFPFPSSAPVPLDNTQGDSLTRTVLKEDTPATVSSTSFPSSVSLTSLSPFGKSISVRGDAAGLPESTQDPGRSSEVPDQGGSPDSGLLDATQEGHGEPNSTGRAVVSGDHNTSPSSGMKDVPMSTVAVPAARMGGTSSPFPHQSFLSVEAITGLSTTQGGRGNSEDPDYIMSSHGSENNQIGTEGPQVHQLYPGGVKSGDESPAMTTSVYQETAAGRGNKVPGSPTSSSLDLPSSTEPSVLEHNVTSPGRFPPTPPTPREEKANEIKAEWDTEFTSSRKDQGLYGNSSTVLGKNSPNGVQWTFTDSDGGLGPHLKTEKQQEGEEASSLAPSATIPPVLGARWEAGNWSECSTTCGLGAIWRTVRCSSGVEEDCSATRKPIPARRCYLRPCSSWHVGNWSKCSRTCGSGVKVRDVSCTDTRDLRPLRPFHCQAVLYKPPAKMPCQTQECLDWYTSSWRECSELCGGGEQERLVTCPEAGRCDEALRPNNTRLCNSHPCTKWTVGSWGQCTATCGGGVQRRQVKCVNVKTGEAEEDSGRCDHELRPEKTQKCSLQNCPHSEPGFVCERDRLSFSFCQTLLFLGRCHLPTVSTQCCETCHQHGHGGPRDRGNERASRR
ncbi:UNVERIFIED_CONTAM: hypothetical protein K2H54_021806 [Gekko kuhli]